MNHGPSLSTGASGPDVRRLQRLLVMLKLLGFTEISGSFGSSTAQAVKDFQESEGLTADGIAGPATWQRLPADPKTPLLKQGATGVAVSALQQGLKKLGEAGTDPGAADGDFGPHTAAAARAFQSGRGLAADGVVGDQTWWAPAGAAGATLASLAGLTTV